MADPWPVQEARKILERMRARDPASEVVFETGFGPSGLPHIGTFAEVARTTFVRNAFRDLTQDRTPTRLIVFSDDLDGMRSVPLSVPEREALSAHLGKPLSSVPDPFREDPSYAAHMNRMLRQFLDRFGFDYEFRSATECYRAGHFDEVLRRAAEVHDEIVARIARTMRAENRAGYSPFLPTCPACGRNLTGGVAGVDRATDTLRMECRDQQNMAGCGFRGPVSYLGGGAKLRWKADWALRWTANRVDYEMFGKDLNDTVAESRDVCRILGGEPPVGMFYEMLLDADGAKISKSIGKGLTVDRWARWAPVESLLFWLYDNPRKARRLHAPVVPGAVDEFLSALAAWPGLSPTERDQTPLRFFRDLLRFASYASGVSYSLIQSLIAVLGPDKKLVLDTVQHAHPESERDLTLLGEMVDGALRFDADNSASSVRLKTPPRDAGDRALLLRFIDWLERDVDGDSEAIQAAVFTTARAAGRQPAELFRLLYQTLLGSDRGPRIGTLTLLIGRQETVRRLRQMSGLAEPAGAPAGNPASLPE